MERNRFTKRNWFSTLFVFGITAALLLSACQPATPAAQSTPPPVAQPTEAKVEAPTEALQPAATQPPSSPTQPAASTAPTEKPASEGPKSVTITYVEEPESLNPLYTQNWYAWTTWDLNLSPLWAIDGDGKYHMVLAQEMPSLENGGISKDGLKITLKLNKDAVWSDGEPITADDVVFTYDMIMADKNTVASRYPFDTYIKGMQAVDEKTVEIELTEPYADWMTAFFMRDSRVLPKHILQPVFDKDGTLDNAEWNRTPNVGSGPFVVTEWQTGSHIALEANPKYWLGKPQLDQIYIRIVPDHKAQMASLSTGDSDIGAYMLGSDQPEVEKMGNVKLDTAFSGNTEAIFLNVDPKTASPGISEVNVRKAIALAINRQQIIDQIFYGLYEIPATFWFGTPYDNANLKPWPYDPKQAKTVLEEAGWKDTNGDGIREKDGKDLVIRYSTMTGNESREQTAVVLQQMLADVGIKMEINNYSEDILFASYGNDGPIATGDYDLSQWSDGMWYFPSPDTSYFLCDQIPSDEAPDGYNWFGVCDPQLDELFQKQASEVDVNQRIKDFQDIGQIMYDQVFWIPIRTDPDVWAVNDRVQNVKFSGVHPFWNAIQWNVK